MREKPEFGDEETEATYEEQFEALAKNATELLRNEKTTQFALVTMTDSQLRMVVFGGVWMLSGASVALAQKTRQIIPDLEFDPALRGPLS